MSIETELLSHLNTNWSGAPTISYANSNVSVKYSASTEYIVPRIVLAVSEIMEIPYTTGGVRRDYVFGLNLLVKDNTGMAGVNTYASVLSNLYHKKDITTSSYIYHFDALEVSQGFGSGSHFEVPVSINFFVYSL